MLCNKIISPANSEKKGMPKEWEFFRNLANENESAFLIANGGIDTIAFTADEEFMMKIYGGEDGTELLFTFYSGSSKKIDLWNIDPINYPLPTGLVFSLLNGKAYSDEKLGEVELFTVVTSKTDGSPVGVAVAETEYSTIGLPYYRVLACDLNIPAESATRGCVKNTLDLEYVFFKSSMSAIPAYAFQNSGLRECNIPENITQLSTAAFYGTPIEKIYIPDGVTFLGEYLFAQCSYLKEVHLPTGATTVNAAMFSGCTSLAKIEIPQNYTKIADTAFYGCRSLKEVDLHSGINDFHPNLLFSNCDVLDRIEYHGTVTKARDGSDFASNCHQLRYIDMPNVRLKAFGCQGKNASAKNKIGYADTEGREAIVLDWANFETGTTAATVWNTSYTCLLETDYLSIFNHFYENGKVFSGKNFIITGSDGATDTVRDFITDKLGAVCVG